MKIVQVCIGRQPTSDIIETMKKNVKYAEGNNSQYILVSSKNFLDVDKWIDINEYLDDMSEAAVKLFRSFGTSNSGYEHKNMLIAYHMLSKQDDVVFVNNHIEILTTPPLDQMSIATFNSGSIVVVYSTDVMCSGIDCKVMESLYDRLVYNVGGDVFRVVNIMCRTLAVNKLIKNENYR